MWIYRERLNSYEKLRRSLYEILRDTLEARLMKISLIDSFYNFVKNGVEYNFLEKSELKPKSKKMEKESDFYNTFIVIFCEGTINSELKNHLRFFPENKVIKKNVEYLAEFSLAKNYHTNLRYFDEPKFLDFVEDLLNVDYALLVQQDATVKKRNRYSLTHFHVKIDWPIADAAEDLCRWLRYVQNNLYENGDKEAHILQNKLFEYYACHHSVGGRRTAGLIAAQLSVRWILYPQSLYPVPSPGAWSSILKEEFPSSFSSSSTKTNSPPCPKKRAWRWKPSNHPTFIRQKGTTWGFQKPFTVIPHLQSPLKTAGSEGRDPLITG